MEITTSININAPIEKVFQAFSDLEKIEQRIKGISKIELLEGSPQMEVGTKWKETRTMFGKEATEIMWVSEINQPNSYVVEAESHGTKYYSLYTFEPLDNGTKVTMVFKGKPISVAAKLMSFMAILFSGSMKKMLLQNMQDLKNILEQR